MPQHVEIGGLREHTIDPAAVYEITLRGAPPAGLTAKFPSVELYVLTAAPQAVPHAAGHGHCRAGG